jgi:hypothetical protein
MIKYGEMPEIWVELPAGTREQVGRGGWTEVRFYAVWNAFENVRVAGQQKIARG